jgi:hypothetical protein
MALTANGIRKFNYRVDALAGGHCRVVVVVGLRVLQERLAELLHQQRGVRHQLGSKLVDDRLQCRHHRVVANLCGGVAGAAVQAWGALCDDCFGPPRT